MVAVSLQNAQSASPLEKAIKRIWKEKGEVIFDEAQSHSFGEGHNHLIHSDFLGKLNRACNAENDPFAPSVVATAEIARKANEVLQNMATSQFIGSREIVERLLDLSEEIAYAVENPSSTQEFKIDLFSRLKGKDEFDPKRGKACNDLISLSESDNIEDQRAAVYCMQFVSGFDIANPFTPVFHKEVILAVIKASERLPADLAPHPESVIIHAARNNQSNDSNLTTAALSAAESIIVKSFAARGVTEGSFLNDDAIKFLKNVNQNSAAYKQLLAATAQACKDYDPENLNKAAKFLSTKPKIAFDFLKSAFEEAIDRSDPNASNILDVMTKLPRQKLRTAMYLESLLIVRSNDLDTRDVITGALDKMSKVAKGMAKLWGMLKVRKEKEEN